MPFNLQWDLIKRVAVRRLGFMPITYLYLTSFKTLSLRLFISQPNE